MVIKDFPDKAARNQEVAAVPTLCSSLLPVPLVSFPPSTPSSATRAPEPPTAAGQAEPPARGVTRGLLLWRWTHHLHQAALQAQGRHLSVVIHCGYVSAGGWGAQVGPRQEGVAAPDSGVLG